MKSGKRLVRERLDDVLAAANTIGLHLQRGDLTDPLVFDAVRMRLVEIGEVKLDHVQRGDSRP